MLAPGIGRPVLYGLAAFGEPGVDRVLSLLRDETAMVRRICDRGAGLRA